MVDTPPELGLGPTQLSVRSVECDRQFIEIIGPPIGQYVVHLIPDGFIRVEFGGIRRESLQVKSRKAATELADDFALVRFAVVPDDDDMTPEMAKQMTQELANLGLLDVLAVEPTIQSKAPA